MRALRRRERPGQVGDNLIMPPTQSAEQIQELLDRLRGREVAALQVLGINSLKSISPAPETLIGETVSGSDVTERIVTVHTTTISITFDLQRTGRLVWLESAEPYRSAGGTSRPTVRLLLADGAALDMTEPAKTKRIAVTLVATVK